MQVTEPPAPQFIARPNNRLALIMLATTAVYALITHELLWSSDFGLNLSLTVILFLASLCITVKLGVVQLRGGGRWMALPIAIFAIFYVIRDSQNLRIYNVLAILIAFGVMGLRTQQGQVRVASVVSYIAGMFSTGVEMLLGAFPLLTNEIDWRLIALWRPWQIWRRVAVGVLLAIAVCAASNGSRP